MIRVFPITSLLAIALVMGGCAATEEASPAEVPVTPAASSEYHSPQIAAKAERLANDLSDHPDAEFAAKVTKLGDFYYKPEPDPDIELKVDPDNPYVLRLVTGYALSANQCRDWVVMAYGRVNDDRGTVRLENPKGEVLATYGPKGLVVKD